MTKEIYFSIDVETDGPIPGPYSMLSLGAAAFLEGNPEPVAFFSMNLDMLPGAVSDPNTMKWWETQPLAWEQCRKDPQSPEFVMMEFQSWVESVSEEYDAKPVCVAYPAGFDFMFVYWYLIQYAGESPFSFSCVDIKTYAMSLMKSPYRKSTKKHMPKSWIPEVPHTHNAAEDALEQGKLFMNMLRENLEGTPGQNLCSGCGKTLLEKNAYLTNEEGVFCMDCVMESLKEK